MPDQDQRDDQEQSETFDETHLDDEGDGDFLLDEAEPVLDVTRARGDVGDTPYDEHDIDPDVLAAQDEADDDDASGIDEIELVYSGLMENERGAQSSAAHWESRTLSDDDVEALGYGPDDAPSPANRGTPP